MQLKMYRPNITPPDIPPPPGFAIRNMLPGEEPAWSFCCLGEFGIEQATPEGFYAKSMEEQALSEIFFICNADGQPVGTATAQLKEDKPYLHYISVHPGWRGKGLAKPLMSAVLQRHAALGRGGCYLTTDDPRLPAINSYVQLGWRPVLWSEDAVPRWQKVMALLGINALEAYNEKEEIICQNLNSLS